MEQSKHNIPQGRHALPDIDTLGYIQCVTCGKMLGNLYSRADELRRKHLSEIEVYEKLGLKRTCCRYHLTLGIKMPMVRYIDENVRLDLIGTSNEHEEMDRDDEKQETSDKEKVNGIKNRLVKLRNASNQVMGNETLFQNGTESKNSKRISMFVAT